MISASALMTAVPDLHDRGAFMGVNASIQQIAGGVASIIAGMIVKETASGYLDNYGILGNVVVLAVILTIFLMYNLHRYISGKQQQVTVPVAKALEDPV